MISSLPSINDNLIRLENSATELRNKHDFFSAIKFCGDGRRVFFAAHGRLLFGDEAITQEAYEAFVKLVVAGLSDLDSIPVKSSVDRVRISGYRRSIEFRLNCMKILVMDSEQKAFEMLTRGAYFGELRPAGTTVEDRLLRQLAHLQWELDHEKGPYVDACHVFIEIMKPYQAMLKSEHAPPTKSDIGTVIDTILEYFQKAVLAGQAAEPDSERIAKACIRRSAQVICQVVATELETDIERPRRQHDDHMAVLANRDWLRRYQGLTVVVGLRDGKRDILGAGQDPGKAWENARANFPTNFSESPRGMRVTFVDIPNVSRQKIME